MIVSFQNLDFIVIGIIVLIVLLGFRYLAILISTYKGGFEKDDRQTLIVMMPRGLAAAILAIKFGPDFVEKYMPGSNGFFRDVAFVIILGTAIITTVGVSIISQMEMRKLRNSNQNNKC